MKEEIAEEIAVEKFEASKRLVHEVEGKPSPNITVQGKAISANIEASASYSIKTR